MDLGFPLGSMAFGDADGDGAMDLIIWGRNLFRWYRDVSKSGERRFEFVANLQDFGLHVDLKLLETVSMSPSLQLVDWDGDGKLDLVTGGRGGNALYYPAQDGSRLRQGLSLPTEHGLAATATAPWSFTRISACATASSASRPASG